MKTVSPGHIGSNEGSAGLGMAFAIASAFGFSFKAILVKLGLAHGSDAITLLALRMGFAAPVFAFMAWRAGAASFTARDWAGLAAMGLLGYYLSSLFDFLGLQFISVGLERLILFLYPTLVVLLSPLFFGHALTRRTAGALALSYAGIGLALGHDLHVAGDTGTLLIGCGWVFASAVTYALYFMGSSRVVARLGAARFTAYASLFACLFCLGHFLASRPLSALIVPPRVYLDGLALALVSTVLPIYFQAQAMRQLTPGKVAMVGTLGPVLTIFLGWIILDEAVSAQQMAGAALVVGGVSLIGRR